MKKTLVLLVAILAAGCVEKNSYTLTGGTGVGGGQTNGTQPTGATNACGQTVSKQEVDTPNPAVLNGVGQTMTVSFAAFSGVASASQAPCLNGVTINWNATGTPAGACALAGTSGSTSDTVQENAVGSCLVCASAFSSIDPGCATITLK